MQAELRIKNQKKISLYISQIYISFFHFPFSFFFLLHLQLHTNLFFLSSQYLLQYFWNES